MLWKPKKYQKKGMKFMLERGAAGMFLDPGLGKTSITLGMFKVLKNAGATTGMLVVAPLRPCYLVWPREVDKWDDFKDLSVGILHGPNKDAVLAEKHDIYLINPEGLQWLLTKTNMRKLRADILVIDESTKFKKTDTLRFKTLKPWLGKFNRRYILTGTPSPNGYMDLFGQVYCLDLGNALGQFVTHYRAKFFTPDGPFDYVLKDGASEHIAKALKPLCLRMKAEDYLELPPLIDNNIMIEMPKKAHGIYIEMENKLFTLLDKKAVVAANVGVATGKCRQIANGGIYYSDLGVKKQGFEHVHDAKVEALKDLFEEVSGQPMLVLYEFGHDLDRLQKAFGKDTPRIGVSPKKDALVEAAWNHGEIPMLFAQAASVSLGLNMQSGGPHVVWFSIPWDLEVYDQATRRIWRQGVTHARVFRHHLMMSGTIDETVLQRLQEKDATQSRLMLALEDRRRRVA